MIFWLAGSIGQLFSGFLQAAAYTNLNGVHGYEGWRWLFIIDGIITVPLALLGYAFFPNLPQSGQKSWWITDVEQELSVKRMDAIGRAGKEAWTRAKVKKILSSWHFYFLRESIYIQHLLGSSDLLIIKCSYAVCYLEQWGPAARNGVLAEELQRQDSSSPRHNFYSA
jgi:MFS family permease